jgi:hypothetical protein
MKNTMFRFLNTLHPELYCIRTKFGDVPQYYKDRNYAIVDVKYKDIDKLCNTFGISKEDGVIVYNNWLNSRPVYTRLKNSTNDSVLVPVL